jgi:mono/diheme cytochrome c family protein
VTPTTPGRTGILVSAAIVFAAAVTPALTSSQQAAAPAAVRQAAATRSPDAAFLKQYCVTCHSARLQSGGLALDGLDPGAVEGHAEVWEKVVRKLRTGMMPPAGAPKPTDAAREAFTATLEGTLDRVAAQRLDPGAPALHRLNRAEYANAVRDLLALDLDVSALLPPDDSAAGFDNIADVLTMSPALIEGYVAAAAKISRLAVGDPSIGLDRTVYRIPGDISQEEHVEGLPFGTRGGVVVRHLFPLDAEYDLQVPQGGGGRLGGPAPGARGNSLYVALDGTRITVQGRGATRVRVPAGPHTITAASIVQTRTAGADGIFHVEARTPGVTQVVISGPHNPTGPGDTPSRRQLLICTPASSAEEEPCATRILTRLATRAYRRPIGESDPALRVLLEFYRAGRGSRFESGIQRAVARVLVDPEFLFRLERQPASVSAGTAYRLNDLDLASRLSFFLWSSIPDDELRDVAVRGRLKDPAELARQVRRMLADPRAEALVSNFAGQWLYLRELRNARPDSPDFDGNLRTSFQRETELLFRTIVQEDRSVVELLDSDFTFVDERLARHYGVPGVRGSRMRRVSLPADSPRRGLLGHGSILTLTSAANRTSPVVRGKWILENVLGAPPPQPPPGVETNLEKDPAQVKVTTLRQRLELHRASPACASCHRLIDPIGLALENFDHTGKWRTMDGTAAIDATSQMVDGTKVDGPASLRRALLARSDVFVLVMAEKLLTYATGRAMRPEDMPAVRRIAHEMAAQGNRFSSMVLGVVAAPQFQMRTASPVMRTGN